MKVVASWPDYGHQRIVAVTESGEAFYLPQISDPSVSIVGADWHPLAPCIKPPQAKSPIQRFEDGLAGYNERALGDPKLFLLGPTDIDRMEKLMREGLRFPIHEGKAVRMQFNGIAIVGHRGVEVGTVVVCDENFKVLGAFAWPE